MADEAIGVAILDRTNPIHTLYLACHREGAKYTRYTSIPVYPAGTPKPDVNKGNCWAYVREGDKLHLTPSLRIGHTEKGVFIEEYHGSYHWSVKWADGIPYENEIHCNGEDCYVQFRKYNPDIKI